MTIKDGIIYLLHEKNISNYELCKRADLNQSTLSNLIRRGNTPSLETLEKICAGLNIQILDFFYFIETERYVSNAKELLDLYSSLSPQLQTFALDILKDFKHSVSI